MRIALIGAVAASLLAPQSALTPVQVAIVRDDPPASPQDVRMLAYPKPAGRSHALFDGRDLKGWQPWLGYADTALTFKPRTVAPLGTNVDTSAIFSVVQVDGGPAIRIGGRYWGSLTTTGDYANYHLSLEYKWGEAKPGEVRNNGVIYFSHGAPGAVFGTWMTGIEFQLEHGSNGMAIPDGGGMRARVAVAQDKRLPYPYRRFQLHGREIDLANADGAYSVEAAIDAEKPAGEWNRLDLYVVGSDAVHVVNGQPVMLLRDVSEIGADGRRVKLTHGRIQLQCEGAETFFRNIRIEPIRVLPRLLDRKGIR
jgi:hypothetical protein